MIITYFSFYLNQNTWSRWCLIHNTWVRFWTPLVHDRPREEDNEMKFNTKWRDFLHIIEVLKLCQASLGVLSHPRRLGKFLNSPRMWKTGRRRCIQQIWWSSLRSSMTFYTFQWSFEVLLVMMLFERILRNLFVLFGWFLSRPRLRELERRRHSNFKTVGWNSMKTRAIFNKLQWSFGTSSSCCLSDFLNSPHTWKTAGKRYSKLLGGFKSFVRFYVSTLNCNISVNTYSILSK